MGHCQSEMADDTAEELGTFICTDDAENMLKLMDEATVVVENCLQGRPLLHVAAGAGSLGCTRALLARGANVNRALVNMGETPLHLAAGRKRFTYFAPDSNRVWSFGKHIPAPTHSTTSSDGKGDRAVPVEAEEDWDEVVRGDVCRALLEAGADIRALDRLGRSALHVAAEEGQTSASLVLVERCSEMLQVRDQSGATPLYLASRAGHWAVAACHLMRGCDVDAVLAPAGLPVSHQDTALHAALSQNHQDVAILLCSEGADVNLPMPGGRSPLHHAVRYCSPAVVSAVLQAGADVDARDPNNATPLFCALRTGELQLLDRLPRRIVVTDSGRLSVTEERKNILRCVLETVRLLLEAGAQMDQPCVPGKTALRVCLEYEMEAVAALLIQHGAAVEREALQSLLLDVVVRRAVEMAPVLIMLTELSQRSWSDARQCALQSLGLRSCQELTARQDRHPYVIRLWQTLSELPSLQTMCRARIRQAILADWNISLLPAVHLLPLPEIVKNYLTMVEWSPKDS